MYIFEYRLLPPNIHLASTHVMNAPRPSSFFAAPVYYSECKWKVYKNGGGLGTRLGDYYTFKPLKVL